MYNDPSVPCIDCKDRCIGCHGKCPKYKAWQEKHAKEVKEQKFANLKDKVFWRDNKKGREF